MISLLKSSLLQQQPNLAHGFATRNGGVSQKSFHSLNVTLNHGDSPENVQENRSRITQALGGTLSQLCMVHQVHGKTVMTVENPWSLEKRPEADAMVTRIPGLILGIATADCVPVLFSDAQNGVIGAAHAGWRGATSGILENTLDAMKSLGARVENITAALGPCIWQETYEVDAAFYQNLPNDQAFFQPSPRANHWMFDLPGYVIKRLKSLEIIRIDPSPANTFAHPDQFFSFRRKTLQQEPPCGCQLSVIQLKETL
jgi:polyphenol oxidase